MMAGVAPPELANVLRERTAALHAQAERSGIVNAILRGAVTRAGYALFLRNLLPAYRALETSLAQHRNDAVIGGLYRPEILRVPSIEHDLSRLAGARWAETLPILPAGSDYARRVVDASHPTPERLIAHAYTRYMGDLGGGAILRTRLLAAACFEEECLTFHTFPSVSDVRALAQQYRAAIDAAGRVARSPATVVDEAITAFELNIKLSEALESAAELGHEGRGG